MSNIAEGFERRGTKEFVQFLAVAKGSAGELRAQLYVALDQGYVDQADFESMNQKAFKISRMLGELMRYLRESNLKGTKFKSTDLELGT